MAAIATMTVRLSAQIAEFQSEFRNATKSAEQFASSFEGIATRAAAVGTFLGNIATKIASSIAGAFGTAIRDAVRLSSEFNNAFIGLGSVARAFGTDADAAGAAARRLSSDGLLPLKDSATGLKNLLATGFNLEQSVQLMNAFKDSAAFGRQGALSFGDAIRSATEGVKNGNSILVDNAGITKNLSQILKEAGFSAQDLSRASSDAGVRMALFNGILKEAAAFTGDAAKAANTYTGQLTRVETAYNNLLSTWGDAVTQNATVAAALEAVGDAIISLNRHLSDNKNAFGLVSEGVIIFAKSIQGVIGAVDLALRAFNAMDTALKFMVNAFAVGNLAMTTMLVNIANVASKLPGGSAAISAFSGELVTLLQAQKLFGDIARSSAKDIADNAERVDKWGGRLGEAKEHLGRLITELEATRGKTVEVGDAAGRTGNRLANELGKGATQAAAEARKVRDAIEEMHLSFNSVEERLDKVFEDFDKKRIAEDIKSIAEEVALVEFQIFHTFDLLDDRIADFGAFIKSEIDSVEERLNSIEAVDPTLWDQTFGSMAATARTAVSALVRTFEQGFDSISEFMSNFAKQFATDIVGTVLSYIPIIGDELSRLARPLINWAADFFGDLFNRNKGRDVVKSFAESFGGFDALHKRLLEMGAAGEALWVKLTQGVGRNNPTQAAAVVKEVEEALAAFGTEAERAQRRMDALGVAVEGVNRKAALFAAPFEKLTESIKGASGSELDTLTQKMQAMAQAGQAEFERLGTFVGAAFAGIVRESGDALGAISQLTPAFQVLQRGVNEFGLTSTGTIDALLKMFGLVNDAVTGPILQSIQATGQIFAGLQDAGFMTAELFQTVAADIGASFRDLEAKGGDVAQAMALSQPVLQRLWEAQQIYGEITDETTRKLLKQAEEQGLVGAHMKDVNQKILDVLIAIADVFGAVLPDSIRIMSEQSQRSFREMRDAARQTREDLKDAFSDIRVDPVIVPIEYDDPGFTPKSGSLRIDVDGIPQLASGGVVRRPTLALVGEAGPEAVVPLSQLSSMGQADVGMTTAILEVDGRAIAEAVFPHLPGVVRRHGLV